MIRQPRRSTLFPHTTLSRSETGTRRADLVAERDRLTRKRDALRKKMLTADYDEELFGYDQDVRELAEQLDRKSTRLNSSHSQISYAVFCLKIKSVRPGLPPL